MMIQHNVVRVSHVMANIAKTMKDVLVAITMAEAAAAMMLILVVASTHSTSLTCFLSKLLSWATYKLLTFWDCIQVYSAAQTKVFMSLTFMCWQLVCHNKFSMALSYARMSRKPITWSLMISYLLIPMAPYKNAAVQQSKSHSHSSAQNSNKNIMCVTSQTLTQSLEPTHTLMAAAAQQLIPLIASALRLSLITSRLIPRAKSSK